MDIEFYKEKYQDSDQLEVWGILSITRSMLVNKNTTKEEREQVKTAISKSIKDDLRTWLFTEDKVEDFVKEEEQWELLFEAVERLRFEDKSRRMFKDKKGLSREELKRDELTGGLLTLIMRKIEETE